MTAVVNTQIEIDENGTAWISATKVKVVEVVIEKLVHGLSAEEIRFQYPHLSLSQIHSAFAFYHENERAIEAEIELRWQETNRLAESAATSPLQTKLRVLKFSR